MSRGQSEICAQIWTIAQYFNFSHESIRQIRENAISFSTVAKNKQIS